LIVLNPEVAAAIHLNIDLVIFIFNASGIFFLICETLLILFAAKINYPEVLEDLLSSMQFSGEFTSLYAL